MDKATLKKTNRRPSPTPEAQGEAIQATHVTDVFPAARSVTLKGREFSLSPFDFNDLVEIERQYPSLGEFVTGLAENRAEDIRCFAWLMLRKGAPDLGEPADAGAWLPWQVDALRGVIDTLIAASGLLDPNAEAGTPETTDPPTPTGNSPSAS